MKNIIIQLIILFFIGLISLHVYNCCFNKTLEGLEDGDQWKSYDEALPADSAQATEMIAAKIAGELSSTKDQLIELEAKIGNGEDGLNIRVADAESKISDLLNQIIELRTTLNGLDEIVCGDNDNE